MTSPFVSHGQSQFALKLFLATVAVFGLAGLLAAGLISVGGRWTVAGRVPSLGVFYLTTLLLLIGSVSLHRAVGAVRREKQRPFRRNLLTALVAGTLFVGMQSYALWQILPRKGDSPTATGSSPTSGDATPTATDAVPFMFVAVVLHGLHFSVALAFLVFVTLQGFANRYDHEYFWGVLVCTYFWHVLGIAWVWIFWALTWI